MTDHTSETPGEEHRHARWFKWVENPKTPQRIYVGLIVLCVLLASSDIFHHRHGYSAFEESIFFYGLYGFIAFAFVVQAGRVLRLILRRDEDYYDR
jgi:hypothetical protein